MLVPLRDLRDDEVFDYCVVGSGPAGLTCALGLSDAGKKVVVLEGGGREASPESRGIYEGRVVGDPYFDLDTSRLRFFGGTSNHWGGWCRTLDEIDFTARESHPDAHWPIAKRDLDPFLPRASEILELDPIEPDVELPGGLLRRIDFTYSPPVRFAKKYGARLESDPGVTVALHANLVGLGTNGRAVTRAEAVDFSGNEKRVRAERYILAAGGIENSRLLLWCNQQTNGQIVQEPRSLGRYWMEHPHFTIGDAILARGFLGERRKRVILAPTESALRRDGSLNGSLRVERDYRGTKKLIAEIACVAPELATRFSWMLGRQLVCGTKIRAVWEQEPHADNRIELGAERDRLGVPRTTLYWTKSDRDLATLQRTSRLFGEHLAQNDLGRLRLAPWVLGEAPYPVSGELAGHHHMGGTRMADSAQRGVVDPDCKVFGQDNLYVAGSSVFPSSGHANPTLTIVQLALRLVDHLQGLG